MNKAILVLRSVLIFSVLILQSVLGYALLDPAEREAQEAKKRKLVESTDHTISGSALRDYQEAQEERENREDDPRYDPKKGDDWGLDEEKDSINHEDEEFFEEKEEAYDEAGPGDEAPGDDFNPNEKA